MRYNSRDLFKWIRGIEVQFRGVFFVASSCQKYDLGVKEEVSTNGSNNSAPPDVKRILCTSPEAPGEAASRAHCTKKIENQS